MKSLPHPHGPGNRHPIASTCFTPPTRRWRLTDRRGTADRQGFNYCYQLANGALDIEAVLEQLVIVARIESRHFKNVVRFVVDAAGKTVELKGGPTS